MAPSQRLKSSLGPNRHTLLSCPPVRSPSLARARLGQPDSPDSPHSPEEVRYHVDNLMTLRPAALRGGGVRSCWPMVRPLAIALSITLAATSLAAQTPAEPLTVLSREGRRALATVRVDGREMVALDDLAALFRLTVDEDRFTGGLTVSYQGRDIVLTPEQGLVSVAGRLVSLPSAPVRTSQGWLVPVEFIGRALALAYDENLELRRRSRLVIIGDLHIPQVTVRHQRVGSQARVNFEISPATDYTIVQEDRQLTVRFEADALDATLPGRISGPLVAGVQIVEPPTWVAIDLGPEFWSFRASALPAPTGSADLIIDIMPVAAETTTPDAPSPTALRQPPPLPDLTPSLAMRTIVIDPGHGGEEQGAHGPQGTLEKNITLSVARRLKSEIEQQLGLRVVLTRTGDQAVRLDERAAIANHNKADLFISLHANASTRSSAVGAEIFYLSIDEYGEEARRIAASEGQAISVVGGGLRNIEVILWDMAQVRYLEQSAAFAEVVEEELRAKLRMSPRAIQQAPFRVLVGANMPAVLVEMGFISNPAQERQLASAPFQQAIADALVEGIIRFRDYLQRFMRTGVPAADVAPAAGQPRAREAR